MRATYPIHHRILNKLSWKLIRYRQGKDTPYISLEEITKWASKETGTSYRSMYMSLTGNDKNRITNPDHGVQKSWAYCRHPDRPGEAGFVIRESEEFKSGRYKENKPDYNTPEKTVARTRGFQAFLAACIKAPHILTLGGEEGYCVQELLQSCPDATIVSLECKQTVQKRFRDRFAGCLNIRSVLGELDEYVLKNQLDFDFLNLDAMGYACEKEDRRLSIINGKTRAKYITLTVEHQKTLRNHGPYVDMIRSECKSLGIEDEVRYSVERPLTNFQVVDDYSYMGHRKRMRMFVLSRKDHPEVAKLLEELSRADRIVTKALRSEVASIRGMAEALAFEIKECMDGWRDRRSLVNGMATDLERSLSGKGKARWSDGIRAVLDNMYNMQSKV